MPVKEHGLALLSPCGPSLSLGVGFALDAFFQLNRPDGGPRRGRDRRFESSSLRGLGGCRRCLGCRLTTPERRDGVEQAAAMADRRDTKLAQILGRLDGFCHPLHHGQIAIARGTFRTSTPRGFLPRTLSDDGPVPSRAVAMGRRPKPSQKRSSQGLPDCHGRAAGANQGWSTNVARRHILPRAGI